MTRSEILTDYSTSTLHDERAACLLLTTNRYAGSDSVKEHHADYADRISDEIDHRANS